MRNIFAPRHFRDLTFLERLLHSLITLGLPLSVLDYFFIDGPELGWLVGIPLSVFGGVVGAIFFALLEHAFFKLATKSKRRTGRR